MVIRESAQKIEFTGDDLYQIDLAAEKVAQARVLLTLFHGKTVHREI
ncbi:MAG: hypothetical protein WCW53_08290 [Syntrophales bacterium]